MNTNTTTATALTTGVATALLCLSGTGAAAESHMGESMEAGSQPLIKHEDAGVRLTEHAISGQELLEADLTESVRPIGTVSDAILNDAGAIVFLEYRTSRFRNLDQEGYLPVGELTLQPSTDWSIDVDADETVEGSSRERIELTAEEVESQKLSNILRDELVMDDTTYKIRDVVFDDNGKLHYFLVGRTGGGFLQQGDAFAVPFENLYYEEGAWRSAVVADDMLILIYAPA